ncbi:PREDICTED: uncharacterized protein LOC100635091 [Amphimedon queenslandica]|uniref:Enoyl reductase (ER) domain-containing protein n=1 Tax=Amphimedon queenslandica TaxID=400682 RepID=A0A1X7VWR6_AMPQE|nr:PREDICTED: uncharacterized protein LOC100635091 [Amphimedon queenslandica]|eukprot:XP_003382382.1 PREDICTED: uncharacterized protein LOC100635091 [Amphimedon queenslandica]
MESSSQPLPKYMKALVKESATESYIYKDVLVPQPGQGELLVKVKKVAICGSDITLYKWGEIAKTIAAIPFTPGHETVGEIVQLGSDVPQEYQIGKRICVENHYYCGHCYQCMHGQPHICQNLNQFGHGKGTPYGGCSEYTIVPAKYAYLLQTDLDDSKAAILEPCGVAHQALDAINPIGEDILIQGCGPIGLFAIGLAKVMGATKIIACDIVDAKLKVASQVGADVTVNCKTQNLKEIIMQETSNNGIGRLLDATGVVPMINNCFSLLRKGGSIVLVGLPKEPLHIEDPLPNVVFKSLTLKTVHGRRIFKDWIEPERFLKENKVNTDPIITHDFPMSQFEEAFATLMSGAGCKILMTPGK